MAQRRLQCNFLNLSLLSDSSCSLFGKLFTHNCNISGKIPCSVLSILAQSKRDNKESIYCMYFCCNGELSNASRKKY